MNEKIEKVLSGREENHILPFFWLHGESEETLREYMDVIHRSNIGAVCLESRPIRITAARAGGTTWTSSLTRQRSGT